MNPQQEIDALDTALNRPAQAACLAVHMKPQGQRVQMLEHPQRDTPDGPLTDLGKDIVPQFGKALLAHPQQAVAHQKRDRHRHRIAGLSAGLEGVHRSTEYGWNGHRRDLGGHQQHHRDNHPHPQLDIAPRPHIGGKCTDRAQFSARFGLAAVDIGFGCASVA